MLVVGSVSLAFFRPPTNLSSTLGPPTTAPTNMLGSGLGDANIFHPSKHVMALGWVAIDGEDATVVDLSRIMVTVPDHVRHFHWIISQNVIHLDQKSRIYIITRFTTIKIYIYSLTPSPIEHYFSIRVNYRVSLEML